MKLSNVELIQSTIIDSDDPEKLGRVKCIIPGVFENSAHKDTYPWICPFGMTRYQSFSKELNGMKVWVVQVKDNYNEFYYIPIFEKINITKDYLEEKYDQNPEIVYMRDNAGQISQFTYDDADGCNMSIGEFFIKLKPDGEIHCHGNGADVHINDGIVYIGSDEDGGHEPAVYGNKLYDILSDLQGAMDQLIKSCNSPYLSPLTPGFTKAKQALEPISEIKCKKTQVN